MRKEIVTPGPAFSFACRPVSVKMPVPMTMPIPKPIRSSADRFFLRLPCSWLSGVSSFWWMTSSTLFFLSRSMPCPLRIVPGWGEMACTEACGHRYRPATGADAQAMRSTASGSRVAPAWPRDALPRPGEARHRVLQLVGRQREGKSQSSLADRGAGRVDRGPGVRVRPSSSATATSAELRGAGSVAHAVRPPSAASATSRAGGCRRLDEDVAAVPQLGSPRRQVEVAVLERRGP